LDQLDAAIGIALGLAGIVLLVRPGGAGGGHWQTLVVLLAPLLWAVGSLYARNAPAPKQPLTAVAMEMIAGGVLLSIAGVADGELGHLHLGTMSFASVAAFAYLVLIGALVGLRRIHLAPPPRVSDGSLHLRVREPGRRGRAGGRSCWASR